MAHIQIQLGKLKLTQGNGKVPVAFETNTSCRAPLPLHLPFTLPEEINMQIHLKLVVDAARIRAVLNNAATTIHKYDCVRACCLCE